MKELPLASSAVLRSFGEQLKRLLPGATEIAFLTRDGALAWTPFSATHIGDRLAEGTRAWFAAADPRAQVIDVAAGLALFPVRAHDEPLLALLAPFAATAGESLEHAVERTWRRLRPVLDRLGSQLARRDEANAGALSLMERTEELDWLLRISAELHSATDTAAIDSLLATAVERMNAAFGSITLPERQVSLTHASRTLDDPDSARACRQAHQYLMSYMQRRSEPLVANRPHGGGPGMPVCKIMAVPVVRRDETQTGVIAFCRPAASPDFSSCELSLARHIARLLETLLDRRYDPATGLLTRAAIEQEAARVIEMHAAAEPHTVFYVDIDHLHVINETFGFDFGDQAIAHVARLLRSPLLPANAVCGRVAGDRFVVLLPGCDSTRALHCTQAFQREVNKLTVGLHPTRITLSVSCGIASVAHAPPAFARAMAAAELACRTAKERGRDRSETYLDIDDSMMHRKDDILSVVRLRAALEKDRLQIFAQRIVPLRDLTLTRGIECLVRLVAEDGAIIPPAEFMSAARRYQLLRAIDEWMIERTLAALQPHASLLFHGEMQVALNLSEQSLHDDDFLRFLEDHVHRSDLAPRLITFEIGESAAVRDVVRTSVVIRRLRRLGCSVALDDFGARIGSLAHLQNLRPDRVKIDDATVRAVLADSDAEATVRAIVKLADAFRIECVAKHTESDALVRKLRELGVGCAQGNCLHQAEPLPKVLESLYTEEQRQLERLCPGL